MTSSPMAMKLHSFQPLPAASEDRNIMTETFIRIQEHDFDQALEYAELEKQAPKIGAIVTFCGLVREFDNGQGKGLYLEHYPQMAENTLLAIVEQAAKQWPIINTRIIHRIGTLGLGEKIVFVGVNSEHRDDAFTACKFIMDFLKTDAPFWKKALSHTSETNDYWIEAKDSDREKKQAWDDKLR